MQTNLWNEKSPSKDPRTVKVEVMTAPMLTIAKSGNRFCKGVFRDLDLSDKGLGTFGVVAFKDQAQSVAQVKVGDKVSVTVRPPEKEGDSWILFGLYRPGEEKRETAKSRIIREYGSLEEHKRVQQIFLDTQVKAGRVLVRLNDGLKHWLPKHECVLDGGVWKLRIDYLMDRLGAESVKKSLKRLMPNGTIQLSPEKNTSYGLSKVKAPWARDVRDWINKESDRLSGAVDNPFEETAEELFS